GRDIGNRQRRSFRAQIDRRQQPLVVEQILVEDCARRNHLGQLPGLKGALALAIDLAPDRHTVAHAQQPGQVLALASNGDPGHGQHDWLAVVDLWSSSFWDTVERSQWISTQRSPCSSVRRVALRFKASISARFAVISACSSMACSASSICLIAASSSLIWAI